MQFYEYSIKKLHEKKFIYLKLHLKKLIILKFHENILIMNFINQKIYFEISFKKLN